MSLNKFSEEDTGYDLKLNVGCDALKCNTINGIPYPDPNGLQYQEQIDPTAPTTINAGAFCYFQNEDDKVNVAKTNYAKVVYKGGFGGGQTFDMANSTEIINCPRLATEIADPKYKNATIADGTTSTNLNAQRRFEEGFYVYSVGGAGLPTECNVNAISLSDEQIARDTTYFYRFMVDNVALNIQVSGSRTPPFYTFRANETITAPPNECIEAVYVFSKPTLEWVRCKQLT
jgi:hypothetical protein